MPVGPFLAVLLVPLAGLSLADVSVPKKLAAKENQQQAVEACSDWLAPHPDIHCSRDNR